MRLAAIDPPLFCRLHNDGAAERDFHGAAFAIAECLRDSHIRLIS